MKLIAYGKTNWEKDFPSALEDQAEAKRYVSAFHSALSPLLRELVDEDEHIMRVCSLLAILPPPPGTLLRHLEIPMDLTTMRLTEWVNNIRDLATRVVMLPPTFVVTGKVIQSSILPKLEKVARVKSCRFYFHPHTVCGCSQISAWSHTSTRQTLATVTTAHSHDSTSVSTLIVHPPPGLLPQGAAAPTSTYSEALAFGQAPLTHMRGVSWPPLPGAGYPSVDPHQTAPTPRMEAQIRQECRPSTQKEPRTPYQQQVQAPILLTHSTGVRRGAILEMMRKSQELERQTASVGCGQGLSTKSQGATPQQTGEAPGQDPLGLACGRSQSHLQKGFDQRWSQSTPHPGGRAFASTSGAPSAPLVQLGCFRPRHPADFRGEGWKKDVHWAYLFHISVTIDVTAEEAEALTTPVTRHMEWNRCQWHFVKEDDPLRYSVLLNDFYEEVHRYRLEHLDHYTEWIKPRGWCHKVILNREQLNYCKHLTGVEPPPDDVERPSELTLHSHQAAYEAAKWGGTRKTLKRAWSTLLETLAIHGLEDEYYYILGGEKGPPPINFEMVPMEVCGKEGMAASQEGGDAPPGHKQVSCEEQDRAEEEQASTEDPQRILPLPPSQDTTSTSMPPVAPSTSDDGFTLVRGWKSQDKRPRDPSKDPTP